VILAACVSGRHDRTPGDDNTGFVAALLAGGANAVVASHWSVDARSTSLFVDALLSAWQQTEMTIGEATTTAYRSCREEFDHPFHWAAFSLHGDERLMHRTNTTTKLNGGRGE
jgi:CHAT domain-containing protein